MNMDLETRSWLDETLSLVVRKMEVVTQRFRWEMGGLVLCCFPVLNKMS